MRYARSVTGLAIASHIAFATVAAFASASASDPATTAYAGDRLVHLAQSSTSGYGGSVGGPSGGNGNSGDSGASSAGGHGSGVAPLPNFSQPDSAPAADASGACGGGLQLPDPADYARLFDAVADISKKTQTYVEKCGCATPACVADALDQYADALAKAAAAKPTTRDERLLPRALRDLPKIVHAAAAKARAAKTKKAAVKAVQVAVVEVRKTVAKTIALMRASDPDAKREATRGGALVADTLKVAADQLMRADSL
jgi:hypothetical protein